MAGNAAELKLQVTLDRQFFRGQLAALGQIASGYRFPINVSFDRRSIQNELNSLGTNIRRRQYRLNIQTNLQAEIENAKKLAAALRDLEGARAKQASSAGLGMALLRRPNQGGPSTEQIKKLYEAAAEAGIVAFVNKSERTKAKMAAALEDAGIDAVSGLLNGLNSQDAKISAAAKGLGKSLIASLKSVLQIQSPSRVMQTMGDYAAEGFEIGLTQGLQEAQSSAVAQMRAMLAALQGEASKFGPALMMAMGGGGGTGGLREALLMQAGMAGLYTPQTRGQRMFSQARGAIAAGGGGGGGYIGGALPSYQMGVLPAQGPALPVRGIFAPGSAVREQTIAGLLGPAGSTGLGISSTAQRFAERERLARLRSDVRAASVFREDRMAAVVSGQVPVGPGGPFLPPGGGGGAGGGGGGGRGLGGFAGGVPNLPGAGAIRSLGDEFANAAKQVLLFGTAYKALAFLTNFPAQVSESVAALQSFRNTLNAISPTAQEAAASNQTILDLVDKYNIPLESARSGFTKLYASMQPAGFSGEEIRNLFEGISKGAATFGMSADKVDRVNYAFAQMASKGQVMSEELKGQLGDVLPGAMALFAEAAGFKGPDALTKFSKSLEDGAYKGEAMKQLLTNVGVLMNKEFGPGAEGAAKSFQGLMNRMQNSLKQLYEAFEPVAVGFLNQVVVPMTSGIKTIADGFNAFFTGAGAKTLGGAELKTQLDQLRPAFEGIRQNVQQLLPILKGLVDAALGLGKVFLQVAGNPITGFLLRAYAAVLPLTVAIRALNLQALVPFIASLVRAIPVLTAYIAANIRGASALMSVRAAAVATGQSATAAAAGVRILGGALATIGSAAILLGIGALIERFMSLKAAVDGVNQSTRSMLQSISGMANAGAVQELRNTAKLIQQEQQTYKALLPYVSGGPFGPAKQLTPAVASKMKELGLERFISKDVLGKDYVKDFTGAADIVRARIQGTEKTAAEVRNKLPLAEKVSAQMAADARKALTVQPITPSGGDEEGRKSKLKSYESDLTKEYRNKLAIDLNRLDIQRQSLAISEREYAIQKAELEFNAEQSIIEEQLAIAKRETARENLSAADKAKKLRDLERIAASDLAKITSDYQSTLEKSNIELGKPIDDAIKKERTLMNEQKLRIDNYRDGMLELTPLQEADLAIAEATRELNERDKILLEEKLDILRETIAARAQQQKLMEQEAVLGGLRAQIGVTGQGLQAGFLGEAGGAYEQMLLKGGTEQQAQEAARLTEQLTLLRMNADLAKQSIEGIGNAFATTLIDGTLAMAEGSKSVKETFADLLKSLAQMLFSAAKQMISTYIAIGIARMFAGMGGSGSSAGTQSMSLPAAGSGPVVPGVNAPMLMAANGAIWKGGFTAFADGGVVQGPTLGLVGEGRYNEAIIPMPNGKAVPVDLQGVGGGSTNVVVNVDAKGTSAQGNDAQANSLGRVLAAAVQEELIRQKRPGGLLA